MTEMQISRWIKDNLSQPIQKALSAFPESIWREDHLAAIAQREVGFLIARYVKKRLPFDVMCSLMKGDYGQREGEAEPRFHGYSFWQLDVNTHLEFIKTGGWKNPQKACLKAIQTLEDKRQWLEENVDDFKQWNIERAAIASYNCGQLNVKRALEKDQDIDERTYNHDYSKEVMRFMEIYNNLPLK